MHTPKKDFDLDGAGGELGTVRAGLTAHNDVGSALLLSFTQRLLLKRHTRIAMIKLFFVFGIFDIKF